MDKIILTKEQQKVADLMNDFLESETETVFTLKGIAGAGKSTILHHVLSNYNNIIAATVAHVAKSVLEDILGDLATCMTIAKLLNMRQTISDEGEIKFLPKINSMEDVRLPIEEASIIIIDECSMVDNMTHNLIMRFKQRNAKVIYLGDSSQLSPVAEANDDEDSITFNFTKAELLKSVRYGGIIGDLGQAIRDEIALINSGKAGSKYLFNDLARRQGLECRTSQLDKDGNGIIYLNSMNDVINVTKYHHRNSKSNIELRLVAFRRNTIDIINTEMRWHLYSEQLNNIPYEDFPQFIENEVVISSSGYKNGLVHNNECFKVQSYKEVLGFMDVPCLAVKLDPNPISDATNQQILVLDEKRGRAKYNKILSDLKRTAELDKRQWKNYYRFKEEFCEFEYAIASNSHRVQGSTYNNVIVFEDDILSVTKNRVKNKLQSLYVSCTRAKKRIYVYHKKYKVSQELLPIEIKNDLKL